MGVGYPTSVGVVGLVAGLGSTEVDQLRRLCA